MPETKSYESIAANVAAVRENMRQAAEAAGRDPQDITLVAATKVQTSDTIRNAIRAGITICGENRVQELVAHLEDNAYEGAKVHFIGHLQTNKVKFVVGKVDMIESIDSEHLMDAVEKQAAKLDVTQDILLEAYSPLMRGGALETPVFVELGEKYGKTPAQVVLRWILQHGVIPLPKTVTKSRMITNLDLYGFQLSDEDMAKLDALNRPDGKIGSYPESTHF